MNNYSPEWKRANFSFEWIIIHPNEKKVKKCFPSYRALHDQNKQKWGVANEKSLSFALFTRPLQVVLGLDFCFFLAKLDVWHCVTPRTKVVPRQEEVDWNWKKNDDNVTAIIITFFALIILSKLLILLFESCSFSLTFYFIVGVEALSKLLGHSHLTCSSMS